MVIEARTNETLELHNEDGEGREASVGLGVASWSCPSLYSSTMVGIEDTWTGADIFQCNRVGTIVQFVCCRQDVTVLYDSINEASRPVPPCIHNNVPKVSDLALRGKSESFIISFPFFF